MDKLADKALRWSARLRWGCGAVDVRPGRNHERGLAGGKDLYRIWGEVGRMPGGGLWVCSGDVLRLWWGRCGGVAGCDGGARCGEVAGERLYRSGDILGQ